MANERRRGGEAGLFATLAITTVIVAVLAVTLVRLRKASPRVDSAAMKVNVPGDNVLMLDEPVEQIQR
jgi:hypothetical protein